MSYQQKIAKLLPEPVKSVLRPIKRRLIRFPEKSVSELDYWKSRHKMDGGNFQNNHYERLMLAMAEESNGSFLTGKVVADFGCGPRGSLAWAKSASWRIGIDVLADLYVDEFPQDALSHSMVYLKCTERIIPLPSECVDVMFTMNAMDHVHNFPQMCDEVLRVIKSGGTFIGGFNLNEPPSPCEPQQLTEEIIRKELLDKLKLCSYRVARKGSSKDVYGAFFSGNLGCDKDEIGILWVRAVKES